MEYTGLVLAVPQILALFAVFRELRKRLSGPALVWSVGIMALLWMTTGYAMWLTWTGRIYNASVLWPPIEIRVVVVAIGYSWIVFSAVLFVVYAAARYLARRIGAQAFSPGRRNLLLAGGSAVVAAPIALSGYGMLIERFDYRVTEVDLPVAGLHPDLEGLRIAQISDLHISPFLSVRQAARVVDLTNSLRPRLTVFTGDLISEPGDPLDGAIAELGRLRAEAGVLGCHGNHEMYVRCIPYLTVEAAKRGVFFLRREARQLRWGNGVLNIAGLNYQSIGDPGTYLRGVERLVVPGAANLLLQHNPDVFPAAAAKGFQSMLAGHTHGGQINFEILHENLNPARFRTRFVKGLYRLNGASCYVTTGIGTIGVPVRLGAPPEVALLTLRRA